MEYLFVDTIRIKRMLALMCSVNVAGNWEMKEEDATRTSLEQFVPQTVLSF